MGNDVNLCNKCQTIFKVIAYKFADNTIIAASFYRERGNREQPSPLSSNTTRKQERTLFSVMLRRTVHQRSGSLPESRRERSFNCADSECKPSHVSMNPSSKREWEKKIINVQNSESQ